MSFRLFSIPVTVRGSFWLLSLLIASSRLDQPALAAEWIAVMALAILIHELGHAVAFRAYGHQAAIELHGMGGLTRSIGGTGRLGPRQDAVITFAGPLAGYLLALLVWAATKLIAIPDTPFNAALIRDLLWASAGWSTLNLCPILPLDGGQIMLAGLRARLGARALFPAYAASLVVAVAAMIGSKLAGWTWTLYMCVYFAARNLQALVALKEAPKAATAAADPLFVRAQLLACEAWLARGEHAQALAVARTLPPEAITPELLARLERAVAALNASAGAAGASRTTPSPS